MKDTDEKVDEEKEIKERPHKSNIVNSFGSLSSYGTKNN